VFDVGSSMMFGMGSEGTTNLITRALSAVGRSMETVPDPTQIHYRLPKSPAHPQVQPWGLHILCTETLMVQCVRDLTCKESKASMQSVGAAVRACCSLVTSKGLEVRVWRDYEKFIAELTYRFPHEAKGIRKFYDECWRVRCIHTCRVCIAVGIVRHFSSPQTAFLHTRWQSLQETQA
jgi:prolycopene isomerase